MSNMQKKYLITLFIALIIAFLTYLLNINCPIETLFGISCPGCGISRSQIALLHLDFQMAFYYHPLFFVPLPLILYLYFVIDKPLNTFRTILFSLLFLSVFIVYFIRLFFHHPILECDFTSGLFYQWFH